jgi:hypothetical protein
LAEDQTRVNPHFHFRLVVLDGVFAEVDDADTLAPALSAASSTSSNAGASSMSTP